MMLRDAHGRFGVRRQKVEAAALDARSERAGRQAQTFALAGDRILTPAIAGHTGRRRDPRLVRMIPPEHRRSRAGDIGRHLERETKA